MAIQSDLLRGHTEAIILAHLLDRDSYGYELNKMISEKSDGHFELKEATLYGAFRRLEEAGCIQSYWGDENAAARRRYYHITPQGKAMYAESLKNWVETRRVIDILMREESNGGSEQ